MPDLLKMTKEIKIKKRVVISYANLSDELRALLEKKYPFGYMDSMMRIDKGPGDFFYAVVLEAEEVSYLVKLDVAVDGSIVGEDDEEQEEDDDNYFDDEIKGAEEIADDSESDE